MIYHLYHCFIQHTAFPPLLKAATILIAVVASFHTSPLLAQQIEYLQGPDVRSIVVRKLDSPPVMDGHLPESEWPADSFQSGFWQLTPARGVSSIADPMVAAASDGTALYFAFNCPLPDLEGPVASVTGRDSPSLGSDDMVGLWLDTFGDGRSAFVFYANSLGTQGDQRIANDGETTDSTWDADWEVATSVSEDHWTAEFRIPFKSLTFPAESRTWGVNFARFYPPELSYIIWAGPIDKTFHISRSGRLDEIPLPEPLEPVTVTPYVTARNTSHSLKEDWDYEAGADLEGNLGHAFTLNATLNPDFASVEGDREQINLTPFELSFPEKRRFFIEGNDLWSNRIRTFYTRRIGQIDFGAKVVGRTGRNTIAALIAREASNGISPGTWSVLRLRRDVLKNSTFGLLAVNRHDSGGEVGAFGSDIYLNLASDWYITGQAILSWPDPGLSTGAYFLRVERKTNIYDYHLRYTELGERFMDNVNNTGFIRDDNRRELDSALGYVWWRESGPLRFIQYDSNYNIYWSRTSGRLRNWEIRQEAMVYFRNELSIAYAGAFENQEMDIRFDHHYFNHEHKLELGYKTEEWASTQISCSWGSIYESDLSLVEATVNRVLIPRLTAAYTFIHLDLDPDPDLESSTIHIFRLEYAFTPDLYWRVFGQTNSGNRRLYLYSLFGWRYNPPFSAVYITYTRDRFEGAHWPYEIESHPILFLKISHQIGR